MAVKKSELYKYLWEACDELRGGMDASQYKDYILTLLFIRYASDKYKGQGDLADIEIPKGASFDDMLNLKRDATLGDSIDKQIIGKLVTANPILNNVINIASFNDDDKLGKADDKVKLLSNLLDIFADEKLNFKDNKKENDDLIGDAYEYLMKHFATQSGKSKGQFYTPAEVSRIMAKIIGIKRSKKSNSLYDCACGSGSLLIRAADECDRKITVYGQEKDVATVGMAKMNMVIHGMADASIHQDNTMSAPFFKEQDKNGKEDDSRLKQFDYLVANPPFSLKNWKNGVDTDKYGIYKGYNAFPPDKNGDYAWLLHAIKSLKDRTGKGAIILPHGVLFRGNAEATIRQEIVNRGYIKGIIGLPANLFFGTGIPACILVLDKQNAEERKGIFMIDASKGFVKDGSKNKLREQDIKKITDAFLEEQTIPKFSRFVPKDEIVKNEYNLNIPRYIDNSEEEDLQNLDAHIHGGIPNEDIDSLDQYWKIFPNLKRKLFSEFRDGFSKLNIEKEDISKDIYADKEFSSYANKVDSAFGTWRESTQTKLENLDKEVDPKSFIVNVGENLISAFEKVRLLDKYDVYEVLMKYWQETMYDDLSLICTENNWKEANEIVWEYAKPKKKKDGTLDTNTSRKVIGWHGKILPKSLIANECFMKEMQAIKVLEEALIQGEALLENLIQENDDEESIFNECKNDKGDITRAEVQKKIKEYKSRANDEDYILLARYIEVSDNNAKITSESKILNDVLDESIKNKIQNFSVDEIKNLVINRKWLKEILDGLDALYEKVSHNIANRIIELAERYETTLPELEDNLRYYQSEVKKHLQKIGVLND